MKLLYFKIIILLVLFVTSAFGNTTTLDTTFNGTGYRIQTVGAGNAVGDSIAMQADGKILVSGEARTSPSDDDKKIAVMRLNTDGTLDTSFGTGGIVFSPLRFVSWGTKLLIQPDGKILLGATTWSPELSYTFTVHRFNSNGELDTTFNTTGYSRLNVPTSFWDIFASMALLDDGKIVLIGQALTVPGQNPDWDIAVLRLNADGSPDTSFSGDGMLKIGTSAADESGNSLLPQPGGKIIVGGGETTTSSKYLFTRLNSDGSTDTSFGTGGSTIFQIDFVNNYVFNMAQQSDGRILATGGGKIFRMTADGIRDMSFGTNGIQGGTGTIGAIEMRVIAGDKFVVGMTDGVRRFMKDGAPDTHYSGTFFVPGNSCNMSGVSIQSDGKAVVGGNCRSNSDSITRFAAARFQENRTRQRFVDLDGDERTNISIFRPSNGQWWYLDGTFLSNQIVAGQFGTATDRPVPADYTGDGKADVAVFRPGTGEWFILRSDNGTFYSFPFGTSGDVPVAGDYDGDQLDDAAVFRPSTNEWYVQKSTGGTLITTFGSSGDKPVQSDYDGDFKTDIAIYRPSVGEWWIQRSSDSGIYAFQFGNSTDKPVHGDYTGDNKTDAAFYRPSTGEWFVLRSEDYSYFSLPFGLSDDLPTPGNFWGDTKYDFVVFRPSTNRWHILPSGGSYFYKDFGAPGDQPLPNLFVP